MKRAWRFRAEGTVRVGLLVVAFLGCGCGAGISDRPLDSQDYRVYVGGSFTTWNSVTVGGLVRLKTDGTLDSAFNPLLTFGGGAVASLAAAPDGSLFVGGAFTSVNDGSGSVSLGGLAKISREGNLDTSFLQSGQGLVTFTTGANALLVRGSRLYVGGDFASVKDHSGTTTTAREIAALDTTTGMLDTAFMGAAQGVTTGGVTSLVTDGTWLYGGTNCNGCSYLNDSGSSPGGGVFNVLKMDLVTGAYGQVGHTGNAGFGGMDSIVFALGLRGNDLVLGGVFGLCDGATRPFRCAINLLTDTVEGPFNSTGNDVGSGIVALVDLGTGWAIGGSFSAFPDAWPSRVAEIDYTQGDPVAGFMSDAGGAASGQVNTLAKVGKDRLWAGGTFANWDPGATPVSFMAAVKLPGGELDTAITARLGAGAAVRVIQAVPFP